MKFSAVERGWCTTRVDVLLLRHSLIATRPAITTSAPTWIGNLKNCWINNQHKLAFIVRGSVLVNSFRRTVPTRLLINGRCGQTEHGGLHSCTNINFPSEHSALAEVNQMYHPSAARSLSITWSVQSLPRPRNCSSEWNTPASNSILGAIWDAV